MTSDTQKIEAAFRKSVCDEVHLVAEGVERYVVHVPFQFEDGDHYVVLLKRENNAWILSDEGHTFMHLSYFVPDFNKGNRRSIIDGVLESFHIQDSEGELRLSVPNESFGDALFTYIQAITRIMDVTFLSKEIVRSTFAEDFREVVQSAAEANNRQISLDYTHPEYDREGRYAVDARLNGSTERQVLVFGISNDDQCQYATIAIYKWQEWKERFHPIAVFQDQTEIRRQVLARFSDVAERQFTNLDVARDRLQAYIADQSN